MRWIGSFAESNVDAGDLPTSGFRFLFYSNEGDPREPPHVHVIKDGIDAKFPLWPEITIVYNDGLSARTLRELTEVVKRNRSDFLKAWREFFGSRN